MISGVNVLNLIIEPEVTAVLIGAEVNVHFSNMILMFVILFTLRFSTIVKAGGFSDITGTVSDTLDPGNVETNSTSRSPRLNGE